MAHCRARSDARSTGRRACWKGLAASARPQRWQYLRLSVFPEHDSSFHHARDRCPQQQRCLVFLQMDRSYRTNRPSQACFSAANTLIQRCWKESVPSATPIRVRQAQPHSALPYTNSTSDATEGSELPSFTRTFFHMPENPSHAPDLPRGTAPNSEIASLYKDTIRADHGAVLKYSRTRSRYESGTFPLRISVSTCVCGRLGPEWVHGTEEIAEFNPARVSRAAGLESPCSIDPATLRDPPADNDPLEN